MRLQKWIFRTPPVRVESRRVKPFWLIDGTESSVQRTKTGADAPVREYLHLADVAGMCCILSNGIRKFHSLIFGNRMIWKISFALRWASWCRISTWWTGQMPTSKEFPGRCLSNAALDAIFNMQNAGSIDKAKQLQPDENSWMQRKQTNELWVISSTVSIFSAVLLFQALLAFC